MTGTTIEVRVLKRAAEVLGSERALAHELRVPLRELMAWLEGSDRPTRTSFIAAVDILIARDDMEGLGRLHSLEAGHDDRIPSFPSELKG